MWVKALLKPMIALPGRQSRETPKKAILPLMLSILTRTRTHFLFILILLQPVSLANMCYNSFINFYWQRLFPLPNWFSWPASLKADFRTPVLSTCLPPPPPQSPSPQCWVLGLESHKHSIWVFLPIIHSLLWQQELFLEVKEWLWFIPNSRNTSQTTLIVLVYKPKTLNLRNSQHFNKYFLRTDPGQSSG